ncbi:N-acetyltransferase [Pectobacterium aroidearum]|jgi:putative acetyltransferase|uniref:N-acetyltransferase n=1 Tax=Pectobacterium aroidearum TaxID=1201031 RepID=A0AAW3SSI9_9GAMM|nr:MULTISPECIES: N-acetyltransferase [Pectobacterium]MBA5200097.1 N-acetyltransferase [Pectobacterium aroidearum]MBA5204026.1 N-acetyltransferase [Pectobacterium aroidearum]MBA5228542.1 N-acetyltransferase [Pectobacterium aroidearum]MBA5232903.1 N-acetyltransferase [Pectobacterium aroidearum]MBA5235896.1 N-acetyltransferase [Pectobacterium aroidearum]
MLVRVEIPVDAAGIDSLLRRAFPTGAEADLVHQLREDGLLTLGVVATDDEGGVVGYAAFSPVLIEGEDRLWVALAPLAVDESLRRQGVGEKLVYEGLDALNEFSYTAVVVLGEPAYYSRFGFVPATEHQLHCRWPDSESTFQVYPLADNQVAGENSSEGESGFEQATGLVEYAEPFNRFL